MKEDKKTNKIILIVSIVLILALAIFLIVKTVKKDKPVVDDGSKIVNHDRVDHTGEPNEKTVEEEYGMTKQQAINTIKKLYNGNEFKFDAKVNYESKYIVTVTNEATNIKRVWEVDPSTGRHRELEESEIEKDKDKKDNQEKRIVEKNLK